ncbi:hypothetical protein [Desulfobacula phenolica]|uniref:Uncharacterized protein n=1 Tax=Desulfobacula phenolica TaxID=90732 RepID=A0A1H2I260_9BACT|nr:hypothetical protein [Desulfobacula phenolica]SDU38257.1 hypothetical protein SAMN04487931_107192 [Desulfobacula phenolica]
MKTFKATVYSILGIILVIASTGMSGWAVVIVGGVGLCMILSALTTIIEAFTKIMESLKKPSTPPDQRNDQS